jgi:BirA family biotin operon repressor/biotin-[acetyl-CoA-carboxylase] ligase
MMQAPGPYAGVSRELAGSPFAQIRYLEETASTNSDAAALLGDPSAAGLTIVADYQTRGSGRKGRSWIAERGRSLLITTILPEAIPTQSLWAVPFWVALAVRRALASCNVPADLHWPNDLLVGDDKLAGILCISRTGGDMAWAACGVGINVHRSRQGGDDGIEPSPAYCDDVIPVDRATLLHAVLRDYDATRDALRNPQHIARHWEAEAGLPGRRYRLLKDDDITPFEATALSLATGGSLVVAHDDGTRETIALADARALR